MNGKSPMSYAWGNIHDGINGHVGMPCWFLNRIILLYGEIQV